MAKPKLALIPAAQGSRFYSVLPSDGVGDFNFSRASAATRINKYGLIETVASGQSRLNYPLIDGVVKGCPHHLLEPQRTNLITYSQDFDNASWIKSASSVTANDIVSPDGSSNADKIVETSITSGHFLTQTITTTAADYTFSVFAKAGGRNWFLFRQHTLGLNASFNLSTGTIGTVQSGLTAHIEDYGNGWYKCSVKFTQAVTSNEYRLYVTTADNSTSSYLGDNVSGIYMYAAQLEQGSYATSYIPTSGSTVTRVAETANGAGDASTFNDSEGVLMAEISTFDDSIKQLSISNGTSASAVKFLYLSGNVFSFQVRDNFATQCSINKTLTNVNETIKAAGKYKANSFSLWVNGFKVDVDTNGTVPTGLSELAYDDGSGGSNFYSSTKQIQYFDSALTDSELETLTSWVSFQDMAEGQLYSVE